MISKPKKIAKKILKKIKSKRNLKKIKLKAKKITFSDIVRDLTEIGIKKGDVVLVHSSLKKIGYVENGPKTVLDALIEVLDSEGTLVIPTYPMKGGMLRICQMDDYVFDYKKQKTELGAIPREFLNYSNISRSIHPTHSVSAIGKYSKKITGSHHIGSTFGENSPWAKILELNGKILGIGINLAWTTQYHHVEDIMGDEFPVKVKMDKTYRIKCKVNKKKYIDVEVKPHDPEVAKTRIEKNPFNLNYITEICKNLGIITYGRIGEALSWWVDFKKFFDLLVKLAKLGITIYTTEEDFKKNKLYPYELIKDKLS